MKYTKQTNECILMLANNDQRTFETFLDLMRIESNSSKIRAKCISIFASICGINLNENELLDAYEHFEDQIKDLPLSERGVWYFRVWIF